MDIFSFAWKLLLAFSLGAVIGLEREINEKKSLDTNKKPTALIGLRSFSLITVLGSLVGFLYIHYSGIAILVGAAFFALLILSYFLDTRETHDPGITTELAMIFCFIIGVLLALEVIPIQVTLALTVVLLLFLSQKERIKLVVGDIQKREINAFVSFAIVSFVILPFLPNTSYSIADISGLQAFLKNVGVGGEFLQLDLINPFKLWLVVVLVAGVDFVGYFLEKSVGKKKGWLLASMAGGFVSSTATTQSLAQESKSVQNVNYLVSAAILANLMSFFQIAILIGYMNSLMLIDLLPVLLSIFIASFALFLYFLLSKQNKNSQEKLHEADQVSSAKIIDIHAALKFALLFLVISIVSKIALLFFGNNGFLLATGLGSLIGLDAVMINTAQLAGKSIDFSLAAMAFVFANTVNLFAKSGYSFAIGGKPFAWRFLISVLVIVGASIIGLVLS